MHLLSKGSDRNLKAIDNDIVRGEVVTLLSDKANAFEIENTKKSAQLSVTFWFKPKDLNIHSGTLFGEKGLFYFRYLSNHELQFNHYLRRDVNTLGVVADDVWQHFGFTIEKDSRLKVYYNGDCILTDSIAPNWWARNRGNFIIGKDKYNVDAAGRMDELRIWNKVLSAKEVKEEYDKSLKEPNLSHKLEVYLPFKKDFKDLSVIPKELVSIRNVKLVEDAEKGKVASFTSDSSFVKLNGLSFKNQMTLSLWIKTTKSKSIIGLLGNKDFSFRYTNQRQRMFFSVPMAFTNRSDYKGKYNEDWEHLVAVINYNHIARFYLNGEFVDSVPVEAKSEGKETELIIGKSIWGDPFIGKISEVAIWNRVLSANEVRDVYKGRLESDLLSYKQTTSNSFSWIIGGILTLLVLFLVYFLIVKKNVIIKEENKTDTVLFPKSNAIYLLDGFRAFDAKENDISHEFTPTLIRLFSLVLLYPIVKNRNISSSELSDILWENDTTAQQKSNRSTNMHRLRKILSLIEGVTIEYEDRRWEIKVAHAFIDVLILQDSTTDKILEYPFKNLQLNKVLKIDSMDKIIIQINDLHIEKLKACCEEKMLLKNWEVISKAASLWLSLDTLSEDALKYRITALSKLNRKQTALSVYQHFSGNYEQMLGEKFLISFGDCLLD
ncbi:LamG domain-containing protein [Wenyingzhuangia sp. IMCC45574]